MTPFQPSLSHESLETTVFADSGYFTVDDDVVHDYDMCPFDDEYADVNIYHSNSVVYNPRTPVKPYILTMHYPSTSPRRVHVRDCDIPHLRKVARRCVLFDSAPLS